MNDAVRAGKARYIGIANAYQACHERRTGVGKGSEELHFFRQ